MNTYTIPVRELTSCAAVLRVAAEVIASDMQEKQNPHWRKGCCHAFADIASEVADAGYIGKISYKRRDEMYKHISDAQNLFQEMYLDHGRRFTKNRVYWMGTRSDAGQKRRITALLSAAEAL